MWTKRLNTMVKVCGVIELIALLGAGLFMFIGLHSMALYAGVVVLFFLLLAEIIIWIDRKIKKNVEQDMEEFKQLLNRLYDTKGE